jgi:hypothetical protein
MEKHSSKISFSRFFIWESVVIVIVTMILAIQSANAENAYDVKKLNVSEYGYYVGFPALLKDKSESKLIVSVIGRERPSHHDAKGKEITFLSSDCGKSWSVVEGKQHDILPQDNKRVASANGWTPITVRSEVPEGSYVGHDGAGAYYASGASEVFVDDNKKVVRKSIPMRQHAIAMNYNSASTLTTSTGAIIVAIYLKTKKSHRSYVSYLRLNDIKSDWQPLYPYSDPGETNVGFDETALVELANHEILALMRPDPDTLNEIYASKSFDDGRSWTQPSGTGIKGYPASAVVLDDKVIVFVGNRRTMPMSIDYYRISHDNLKIEDHGTLAHSAGTKAADFGYPLAVACGDRIAIAYYTNDNTNEVYSVVESRPQAYFLQSTSK